MFSHFDNFIVQLERFHYNSLNQIVLLHSFSRKILNELSSDTPGVPRIEEEKSEEESVPTVTTMTMPTPIYQTSTGQYSMYTYHLQALEKNSIISANPYFRTGNFMWEICKSSTSIITVTTFQNLTAQVCPVHIKQDNPNPANRNRIGLL